MSRHRLSIETAEATFLGRDAFRQDDREYPAIPPHELVVVLEHEKVQVYRVQRPGTRMQSFQITFTPEGIALHARRLSKRKPL